MKKKGLLWAWRIGKSIRKQTNLGANDFHIKIDYSSGECEIYSDYKNRRIKQTQKECRR